MSLSRTVFEILSVEYWRDFEIWVRSFKVTGNGTIREITHGFLLAFCGLSRIVSEIKQDIRKSRFVHTPCRYCGHHSRLLEIHGPKLCWWCRAIFWLPFWVAVHPAKLRWSCTYDESEYLLIPKQDPELRPWGNTSTSAVTRSHRRVHILLHISWQWYQLVWAFHPRDTQADRSSFKYFRQTGQRLEENRIEFTDEDTALYNALVISVLLYGSETWTLLKADERRLEAFHMNCQRRILGIRWFHRSTI